MKSRLTLEINDELLALLDGMGETDHAVPPEAAAVLEQLKHIFESGRAMVEPLSCPEQCYMVLLNSFRRAHSSGDTARSERLLVAIEVFEAEWPDDVARYEARFKKDE